MNKEKQLEIFRKELEVTPLEDVAACLKKYEKQNAFEDMLNITCDNLVDIIQRSYLKYDKKIMKSDFVISVFISVADMIKTETLSYYVALSEFFKGNNSGVFEHLKISAKNNFFCDETKPMTAVEFTNCFIAPFKGGYGVTFWNEVYSLISTLNVEKSVLSLCKAVPVFYYSDNTAHISEIFEKLLTEYPDCSIVKEMLAFNYFNNKMWGNAVALFEQLDKCYILFQEDLYFCMAWCYGELKEINNEIEYYNKSVDLFPEGSSAMNNLGYAYYKAKQFNKALECFKKCIDNNWDVKYAANNYVRTLLAMKRFIDAKAFVKASPVKIYKALLDRVAGASRTNKRISADKPLETAEETDFSAVAEKEIDIGVKKHQFTSERILEDELVLRMEMGLEVFGKRLKVYRRKGIYGRQYILSNGKRPDILAEDADGNLYVIELKKDSGYDDAYAQTLDYLEWFDKNWKEKVKNIFGIICLNNPSEELLEKVHGNKRIRIFEYKISYTEC